jgi:hypothetical protein
VAQFVMHLLPYLAMTGAAFWIVWRALGRRLRRRRVQNVEPPAGQTLRALRLSVTTLLVYSGFYVLVALAARQGWFPLFVERPR